MFVRAMMATVTTGGGEYVIRACTITTYALTLYRHVVVQICEPQLQLAHITFHCGIAYYVN